MVAEKLKALRAWMRQQGIDVLHVPYTDRYQSEYLPDHEVFLQWLTGFTGSAGQAFIGQDWAVLCSDSRYTIQAQQEIDPELFTFLETPPQKISDFLKEKCQAGSVIALDAWRVTVQQHKIFQTIATENGWSLVLLTENPLAELWVERPQGKAHPAEIHDKRYAGQDKAEKIQDYIHAFQPNAERVLICEPGLVCWLLNVRGRDVTHTPVLNSMAQITKDGHVTVFVDPRKMTDEVRRTLGNQVTLVAEDKMLETLIAQKTPLQVDPAQCPFFVKDAIISKQIPVVEHADPGLGLRACKNPVEIHGAQTAHQKDARAFEKFLAWFYAQDFAKTIITERDIVATLHACRAEDPDFIDDSFDTIAGYGSNGAIVHYRVTEKTNKRLLPGSLLLLDSGAQYRYGTTDITRTLAIGSPSQQMKKHYQAVLQGLRTLSSARFPKGTTGAQLDTLARQPVWQVGQEYRHGTGHGVGSFLSVHEGPAGISPRSTTPLEPGMILSIEPGIYIAGQYGIRLENLVVVVEDTRPDDAQAMLAFETLTDVPFDPVLSGS